MTSNINIIAIINLTKHLNFLFDLDIKAEILSKAKINKNGDEAAQLFWKILSKFGNTELKYDDINKTKDFLKNLGYRKIEFFDLTFETKNTKELLLALAFVLSRGKLDKVVQTILQNSLFQIDQSLTVRKTFSHISSQNLKNDKDVKERRKWLEGKIMYNRKLIEEYEIAVKNILEKLDKVSTFNFNLSLPELKALFDHDYAYLFLQNTKRIIQIMDNHIQWLKKESEFWDWMNSVTLEIQKE